MRSAVTMGAAFPQQACLLVSGPLSARLLGVDNRGYLAAITAWVMIVALVGVLGVPSSATYYLSRRFERSAMGPDLVRIAAIQLSVLLAVFAFGAVIWLRFQHTGLAGAIVCGALALIAWFVLLYGLAVIQARKQFLAFNVLRTAQPAIYALALTGVVALGVHHLSVTSVMVIWAMSFLLPAFIAVRRSTSLLRGRRRASMRAQKVLWRFGLRAHLGNLSPVESLPLDQVAIVLVFGPRTLGLYAVGYAFANLPRFVSQSAGMVIYPTVASQTTRDASWRLLWRAWIAVTAFVLAAASIVFVLMPTLIRLLFGTAFGGATPIGRVLLIGGVLTASRRVLGDALRGLGRPDRASIAELSMYPWLAVGAPILMVKYGVLGLAWALVVGYAIALTTLLVLAVRDGGLKPLLSERLIGLRRDFGGALRLAPLIVVPIGLGLLVARFNASSTAIAAYALTAFVIVVTLLILMRDRAYWLLWTATALLPLTTVRALGSIGNVSDAVFLLVTFACLGPLVVGGDLFALVRRAGMGLSLLLFSLGALLSTTAAIDARAALIVFVKVVFALWLVPVVIAVASGSPDRLYGLAGAFILGASVSSVAGVSDLVIHTHLQSLVTGIAPQWGRYAGLSGHPNDLGTLAALGLTAAAALYTLGRLRAVFAAAAVAACIGGLVASASLTGVAAAIVGVAIVILLAPIGHTRGRLVRAFVVVAGSGAAALIVIAVSHGVLAARVQSGVLSAPTVGTRVATDRWAFARIEHSPLVGYGLDQAGTGPTHSAALPKIHDLWLQFWYTSGALGLLGMVAYYVGAFRIWRGSSRDLRVVGGAMAAVWLVVSVAEPEVYSRFGTFGIALLLAGALLADPWAITARVGTRIRDGLRPQSMFVWPTTRRELPQ